MPVTKLRPSRPRDRSKTAARSGVDPTPPIPKTAPEVWPGRCHTDEDVAVFTRRVWGKFIPSGLKLSDIEERDPKLFNAIRNYHSFEKKEWPKDLALLSERGRLADAIERVQGSGVEAVTPRELMAIARKLARDYSPN